LKKIKAWGGSGDEGELTERKQQGGGGSKMTVTAAGWTSLHCTVSQHKMSNCTHELTRKGAWQLAYGSKKENDSRIAVAERWHDIFTVAAPVALPCGFCTAVSSRGEETAAAGYEDGVALF
jgi:hypothetical protein